MKTAITFFLILLTGACCLIKPASRRDKKADVNTTIDTLNKYYSDSTYVYKIDSSKTNEEYIDWSSVRINGILPLITNTKDLYQLLGQPDSIVTPVYDNVSMAYFNNDKFKFAYFKDSEFEISGDSAVISYLNFEKKPGLVFNAGSLTLTHNTKLVELKKIFPKAVKSKDKLIVDKIGKCTGISVATSKYCYDDLWLLFFRKGRLIRIDYCFPD